jgi:hypothetical protein
MNDINWKKKASSIIKVELAKKDIGYEELAAKLSDINVSETAGNIATKLNRGTFSFLYALQIFKALGLKKLNLED